MLDLNIVLFEPRIPQNTGNIARTCAATGAKLHLVHPLGFKIDEKRIKHAGLDYWNLVEIFEYKNIQDFFLENEMNIDSNMFFLTTKGKNVYSDAVLPQKCFLIFGREDAGINEEILYKNQDKCLIIPMISDARSLNISNAVAIMAYDFLRQHNFSGLKTEGSLTKF